MRGSEFAELKAFAAIVEERSFVRAAARLRVSPPALSQSIRQLEARIGVRLLNRTTRSVSPTGAGETLFARLAVAFEELEGAVADIHAARDRPAGSLRINVPRVAAVRFIGPILGDFQRAYPDIALTVIVDDTLTDIVRGRFDAGIRLGERLEKDMVAVKLSGDLQMAAVAAPVYLENRAIPRHPQELHQHQCIKFQWPGGGNLYRWEFARGKRSLEIAVEGSLTVNDTELMLNAALGGAGVAYMIDYQVQSWIDAGRLMRFLEPWSPSFPGFFLYHPSPRHVPPALRAFIDFVRARSRE
ncbi:MULTISPECIES: LysR family transcriptional regulator [unclassified Mesorhizobium]|uniref:LysR family transcriptional regulator n=1 Tax=unclassified Mesorhizobium TaxID=325217 RepID=UPI0003CDE09B|nr:MULTISPECIES: LysR family transcriptional regulator [unclassified Mesorhizobium]ESY57841.1 transcriptional regulator [Mesorhizobium sp. LNJC374B00]ESY60540.1 transcriptional regulator [Mesorhizobium sp. LNJC372A00]ESZ59104.1 transcriptional regulator [Mesorhizobium sp. L103C120A0]WJI47598.1 LysR substrate-binding domain-containing protein [Mesorhizobium sp. C120A]WJI83947.1 LysR substrate-binding domain-containing protein [Mesorhizobium sp. C374B]